MLLLSDNENSVTIFLVRIRIVDMSKEKNKLAVGFEIVSVRKFKF